MAGKVVTIVEEKLEPIVTELGYELCEVEYAKKPNGMNLTIFISHPDGIKIEDCEKVHRTIDPILDEIDPTNGAPYTLNVSSLGLDRPIKTDKDFLRNIGKMVTIKLFANKNGKKEFVGKLVEKVESLPSLKASDFKRFLFDGAFSVEFDSQGRILVPQALREQRRYTY